MEGLIRVRPPFLHLEPSTTVKLSCGFKVLEAPPVGYELHPTSEVFVVAVWQPRH